MEEEGRNCSIKQFSMFSIRYSCGLSGIHKAVIQLEASASN